MTYNLNFVSRLATTAVMAASIVGGMAPEAKAGQSNYNHHVTLGNVVRSTGMSPSL